jgi:hypothetical protein
MNCYKITSDEEDNYINSNIDNIHNIVKSRYLEEYIKPEPKPEPAPKQKPAPKKEEIIINSDDIDNNNIRIHKFVRQTINGVERKMVLIDYDVFTRLSGINTPFETSEYIQLQQQEQEQELKRLEREKKAEEIELKRIQEIEAREQKEKIKESISDQRENKRIEITKSQNEIFRRRKIELLNDYKHIPDAKITECGFCNDYKVFPVHFKDENDKPFKINYTNYDKTTNSRVYDISICCVDCYMKHQEKKQIKKEQYTGYCEICKCEYNKTSTASEIAHFKSAKHNKNLELSKINEIKDKRIDLSKLSLKELQKICSKSLNAERYYIINGYTKISKKELLEKMNDKYDFLVLV